MRRHDHRGRRSERRRAQRRPVARHAYFGAGDISVLPQTGQALDVSRDGVLIRTPCPLPEGTPIEVELRPERWAPGRQLILTRGRVARIHECGDGEFDMGVQLHVEPGPRPPFGIAGGSSHTMRDLGSLMANLRPRNAAYANAHRLGWGAGYSRHVRFRQTQTKPSWWNAWRWPLMLLLAGLLSLLLWPTLLRDLQSDGNLYRYEANPRPDVEYRDTMPPVQEPVDNTTPNQRNRRLDTQPVDPLRKTEPPVTHMQWPQPERTTIRDADYPSREQTSNRAQPFSYHDRSQSVPTDLSQTGNGVVLEIDRNAHRMRLFKDGTLQQSFAIGLGRHGATPAGEFTVGNKLTDPDWYNSGNVVPAGDPENPLGRRWLGLSRDGALTPYGIHATNDLNSVGRNDSRGCVRVSPSDIETIFRLCPIGARVVIR